jgi:hypothetical protein
VGSIPHYLKHGKNSFLMRDVSTIALSSVISESFNEDPQNLKIISSKGNLIAEKFTYDHYLIRLKETVFHDH